MGHQAAYAKAVGHSSPRRNATVSQNAPRGRKQIQTTGRENGHRGILDGFRRDRAHIGKRPAEAVTITDIRTRKAAPRDGLFITSQKFATANFWDVG